MELRWFNVPYDSSLWSNIKLADKVGKTEKRTREAFWQMWLISHPATEGLLWDSVVGKHCEAKPLESPVLTPVRKDQQSSYQLQWWTVKGCGLSHPMSISVCTASHIQPRPPCAASGKATLPSWLQPAGTVMLLVKGFTHPSSTCSVCVLPWTSNWPVQLSTLSAGGFFGGCGTTFPFSR